MLRFMFIFIDILRIHTVKPINYDSEKSWKDNI